MDITRLTYAQNRELRGRLFRKSIGYAKHQKRAWRLYLRLERMLGIYKETVYARAN